MRALTCALLGAALVAGQARATAAQAAPAGVQGELVGQLDDAATKLVQLADAFPQDKYTWRPSDGVRSVSEAFMHVVRSNLFFPAFAGVQSPIRFERGMETSVTDKAEVTDLLKRSFDHLRAAIRSLPDADLEKTATVFGEKRTYRDVYLHAVTHAHEHLGQLIAYARINGIAPPWSMARADPQR